MKLVCEKDVILKAINSVTKAVASKTTMPILEGILIQTNDKEVKFTTYDLEIGIEYIMECTVEEQGATVVNAIMFSEIIRKLPDAEIHIEINENNLLVIECEGSLYKLATMNPEEFPELPKIDIENSIEMEQNSLKDMVRKTIFAVSTEENRPIFTGCLFEIRNNKLNVVGKGNKERTIYLNKACIDAINSYLAIRPHDGVKFDSRDALFLSKRKERISNRMVQEIVKKELIKAGLDISKYSVHKLRHTAATLMYQYGDVDIRALQVLLGHESISTTEIYTHVENKQVKNAVESNPLANE